jgi:hypothetical protein
VSDPQVLERLSELETRLRQLEARNLELEDEREIRELLAQYGYHADACRDNAYLDLWSDDCEYNIGSAAGERSWRGKEELEAFITDPAVHHSPGFYGHTLHLQGMNLAIRIDGDQAWAVSYNALVHEVLGKVNVIVAGANRWKFAREQSRWRIVERRHRPVGDPTFASLTEAFERIPS